MKVKRLIGILLGAFAALVAAFLGFAAMQPDEFRVSRSIVIAAPPAAVFEQVNTLRNWEAWNPWAKLDPDMKLTYAGPPAGVGAGYAWTGNSEVGAGRLTIVESRPPETLRLKLEFLEPFAATNDGAFHFRPAGNGTEVTWSMSGRSNLLAKAMHLIFDMDKMVGGMFAKGLADMKTVAEAAAGA